MKEQFFDLARKVERELKAGEILLSTFHAERSDFVRFNQAKVRQAGSVEQRYLTLRLVRARRQASATVTGEDFESLKNILSRLRESLDGLPEDPWLMINEKPQSSSSERRGTLLPPQAVVEAVTGKAQGHDLVGFYAGGTVYRGFADSLGSRHWHEVDSFNFDWSCYRQADQAVKTSYAGFKWRQEDFERAMESALERLPLLGKPRKQIEPGEYRAYLAPRALDELGGLLSWGGFSARARATKQSPLLRMQEGEALSSKVSILENTREGVAPGFQGDGFVKPAEVPLIEKGLLEKPLEIGRAHV